MSIRLQQDQIAKEIVAADTDEKRESLGRKFSSLEDDINALLYIRTGVDVEQDKVITMNDISEEIMNLN